MAVSDVDILTDGDRAMLARLPAPVTATAHAQSSLAGYSPIPLQPILIRSR